MRFSLRIRTCIVMLVALAEGCAHYSALPLDTPATVVTPSPALLIAPADALARPASNPLSIDLSQPMDAAAVAGIAVLANPDLKALRQRTGIAQAQVFAAGLLPDPTFSFGVEHIIGGPVAVDNIAGALATDLNALRTRSTVRRQASALADQSRLELAWAEWQTANQARMLAARVGGLDRLSVIAASGRDVTQSRFEHLLLASARGDITADQLEVARRAAFDAADRLRAYERDLAAARLALNGVMGVAPGARVRLAPTEHVPTKPDATALVAFAVGTRLDLKALQAGYQAQEATVRKAILDQFPTLDLTINGSRDTGRNQLLGPTLSFTLPVWNRNRGGIAIEQATRAALHAEYAARLAQTCIDIAAAAQTVVIVQAQREALLTELRAALHFADASRQAAERGDIAAGIAETARAAFLDRQLATLQSELDLAENTIALELLSGALEESWPQ